MKVKSQHIKKRTIKRKEKVEKMKRIRKEKVLVPWQDNLKTMSWAKEIKLRIFYNEVFM